MEKQKQKRISTLVGIIIIVVVAIIIFGGVFAWQQFATKTRIQSVAAAWDGNWIRKGSDNFIASTLVVKNVTKSSFDFRIDTSVGANMGDMEGVAKINGNTALAVLKDDSVGDQECDVSFNLKDSIITLGTSNGCSVYGGAGVYFDGDYIRNGKIKNLSLSDLTDTNNEAIFNNKEEINAFNKLTGPDADLFINSMMLVDKEGDKDNFGARVYIGSVAHAGNMSAIIMIAPQNKIWAAVIDFPKPDYNVVVRYFTNVPEYYNMLPETIKTWKQDHSITDPGVPNFSVVAVDTDIENQLIWNAKEVIGLYSVGANLMSKNSSLLCLDVKLDQSKNSSADNVYYKVSEKKGLDKAFVSYGDECGSEPFTYLPLFSLSIDKLTGRVFTDADSKNGEMKEIELNPAEKEATGLTTDDIKNKINFYNQLFIKNGKLSNIDENAVYSYFYVYLRRVPDDWSLKFLENNSNSFRWYDNNPCFGAPMGWCRE